MLITPWKQVSQQPAECGLFSCPRRTAQHHQKGLTMDLASAWGLELTLERAQQIRTWRCLDDCTWRAVAAHADEAWGTAWDGNQLYGRDLCEASARLLGEDPAADPWN
jgi:hypothetical protein